MVQLLCIIALNCMLLKCIINRTFLYVMVQVITIGRERYIIGEALFQPSLLGLEALGIVEQLVHSISSVSSENHRQLLENTVLCGGTSCMKGESTPRLFQLMLVARVFDCKWHCLPMKYLRLKLFCKKYSSLC